jgi:hypothetical protein
VVHFSSWLAEKASQDVPLVEVTAFDVQKNRADWSTRDTNQPSSTTAWPVCAPSSTGWSAAEEWDPDAAGGVEKGGQG